MERWTRRCGNSLGLPLFSWLGLSLCLGIAIGCDVIEDKVCSHNLKSGGSGTKVGSAAGQLDGEGTEDAASDQVFLYARVRYFPNPTVRTDDTNVLHMCWYRAESARKFASPSEMEIALQSDPAVAKIEALYQFYTPASDLAAKLQELNDSQASEAQKAGLPQLSLVLGDLDRLALGIGTLIHSAPAALVALSYFGGNFAQLKNSTGNLTTRAIASQLAAGAKKNANSSGSSESGPATPSVSKSATQPAGQSAHLSEGLARGSLHSLAPIAVTMLEKNFRSWGINSPPEAILRLPIEILADFACPAY